MPRKLEGSEHFTSIYQVLDMYFFYKWPTWERKKAGFNKLSAYWILRCKFRLLTPITDSPMSTIHKPNACLMLDHRLWRWPNIEPTLDLYIVFDGTSLRAGYVPANTGRSANADLMLAHRLRRWPNIKTAFAERFMSDGVVRSPKPLFILPRTL